MINFSEIKLVKDPNENFVGIRKSQSGDTCQFWLPMDLMTFLKEISIRCEIYSLKCIVPFANLKMIIKIELIITDFIIKQIKNQTTVSSGGISLQTEEGEPCQLYSKLKMIECVLETYDDLAINSIQRKIKRTEDIDYSN